MLEGSWDLREEASCEYVGEVCDLVVVNVAPLDALNMDMNVPSGSS